MTVKKQHCFFPGHVCVCVILVEKRRTKEGDTG